MPNGDRYPPGYWTENRAHHWFWGLIYKVDGSQIKGFAEDSFRMWSLPVTWEEELDENDNPRTVKQPTKWRATIMARCAFTERSIQLRMELDTGHVTGLVIAHLREDNPYYVLWPRNDPKRKHPLTQMDPSFKRDELWEEPDA